MHNLAILRPNFNDFIKTARKEPKMHKSYYESSDITLDREWNIQKTQ